MTEYCVPTAAGEASFTEKRSEFLGHVRPVESEEEARAFVAEMKKKYYDARHILTAPYETRLERIRRRDGEYMLGRFVREWIPLEDRYFEAIL